MHRIPDPPSVPTNRGAAHNSILGVAGQKTLARGVHDQGRVEGQGQQGASRSVQEGAGARLYKRVALSDLVYERGNGKEEVRARAGAQQVQAHSRSPTTAKFYSTPNARCAAPPPRPSGDLLPGAEVVQAAAGK